MPPFHHDWKVVENMDEQREPGYSSRTSWADPTLREFREYHMRCARCGKEAWWGHTDAPAWGQVGRRTH